MMRNSEKSCHRDLKDQAEADDEGEGTHDLS